MLLLLAGSSIWLLPTLHRVQLLRNSFQTGNEYRTVTVSIPATENSEFAEENECYSCNIDRWESSSAVSIQTTGERE